MLDPKGYYSALGLTPDATVDEIKRAYRERAKRLHPDRNQAPGAKEAFQRLVEAYQTLRQPRSRAHYDAFAVKKDAQQKQTRTENVEPLHCTKCGKESAQIRYVILWRVTSFLVVTSRRPVQGIFCRDCADKEALKASYITWLCGWWGLPWGPIWSIHALVVNLFGGIKPGDTNAAILGQQAAAFFSRDRPDIARALLNQAAKLARSKRLKDELRDALARLGGVDKSRTMRNRWGLLAGSFKLQVLPAMLVVTGIAFLAAQESISSLAVEDTLLALIGDNTSPDTEWLISSSNDYDLDPALSASSPYPVSDHVSKRYAETVDDVVHVYGDFSDDSAVLASLPRGTQVELIEVEFPGTRRLVKLPDGRLGFIPYYNLRVLNGSKRPPLGSDSPLAAAMPHCQPDTQPPHNGYILIQEATGSHQLKVTNGTGKSAFIKLKNPNKDDVLAFFVARNATALIDSVPEGNFKIYFATGDGFSSTCQRFTSDMTVQAFEGYDSFRTTIQGGYIYTTILNVTLHQVVGGNARTTPIPAAEF